MACEFVITQEYLMSILDYDPETGIFIWKARYPHHFEDSKYSKERKCLTWNSKHAGNITGSLYPDGYVYITINSKHYLAHRLAYLYTYGWLPEEVDHINNNGPKSDNRICNLRPSDTITNQYNRGIPKHNTSGYKGVYLTRNKKRWIAEIRSDKKKIHIGTFDTPEEAHEAYKAAALLYHGDYARF